MKIFLSIPGVGLICCAVLVAFVENIKFFKGADKLLSYAGLTPKIDQSGTQTHIGKISKMGPSILRKMLIQSVCVMKRHEYNNIITRFYEKVRKRRGNGRATIAATHKLVKVIYAMLVHRELFREVDKKSWNKKLVKFKVAV